jgi:hypothetical protein
VNNLNKSSVSVDHVELVGTWSRRNLLSSSTTLETIAVYYSLHFYLQSLGYSDYNYALNSILSQINSSLINQQFVYDLKAFSFVYHVEEIFRNVSLSTFSYISSTITEEGDVAASTRSDEVFKDWPLYGQVLLIAGGVGVVGAMLVLLSCWFCWVRGSPLSAFYSSTSFKHDMIKKINNPPPVAAPSASAGGLFSFMTSNDNKLPTSVTTVGNPASERSSQAGVISQNNPVAVSNSEFNCRNSILDQKFINIILSEDNDSGKEKQSSPIASSSLLPNNRTIQRNDLLTEVFDHSQDEKRDDIPLKQISTPGKKELTFELIYNASTTAGSIPPAPDTPIRSSLKQRKPLPVPPLPSTPSAFPVSVSHRSTVEQLIAPPLPPSLASPMGGSMYDTGNHIVSAMEFLSPQQQRAVLRQQQQPLDELTENERQNGNDAASVVSSATKSSITSFRFPSPFKKG